MSDQTIAPEPSAPQTQECAFCAELISIRAKKCKHCGETLDVALRAAEEAKRAATAQPNVYMNAGGGSSSSSAATAATPSGVTVATHPKNRMVAALLAIFVGTFGIHKFYLNRGGWGVLYLIFFWTWIPALVGFIEGIIYLINSDEEFARKYN